MLRITKSKLLVYTELFRAIDTDHSGAIDKKELRAAFLKCGIQASLDDISAIMNLYDTDKDNEMREKEFIQFMHICESVKPHETAKILFMAADTDYSGKIDCDELYSIVEKLGYDVED